MIEQTIIKQDGHGPYLWAVVWKLMPDDKLDDKGYTPRVSVFSDWNKAKLFSDSIEKNGHEVLNIDLAVDQTTRKPEVKEKVKEVEEELEEDAADQLDKEYFGRVQEFAKKAEQRIKEEVHPKRKEFYYLRDIADLLIGISYFDMSPYVKEIVDILQSAGLRLDYEEVHPKRLAWLNPKTTTGNPAKDSLWAFADELEGVNWESLSKAEQKIYGILQEEGVDISTDINGDVTLQRKSG